MKKLFILALLPYLAIASDFEQGFLESQNGVFFIQNSKERIKILSNSTIEKSLPSLEKPSFVVQSNGKPYAYEFKGKRNADTFELEQVPTNIPGPTELRGVLKFVDGKYFINDQEAQFGYTKVLNGYEFDEISKNYYLNKELWIEGDYNDDGVFIMQSLTPAGLFSASQADFQDNAKDFILEEMNTNENSQHNYPTPFRKIIFDKEEVKPGDNALIITMSGRQGDSFGSVNGHFVAGLAQVREDLSLRGEVSNAYVTNGKDILSGNTGLSNYFSNLVQGQNIYRPTYTMIIYGIDGEKLQQFRDALEVSHIEFRTKNLDITAQFNCTTETVKALADAGIKGKYVQAGNFFAGVVSSPLMLLGETPETIYYALSNDPARYQPRPAFNSFVKAALSKNFRKRHGVKRVDYVFYPQIPSKRPVGGTALKSIWPVSKYKELYDKYEGSPESKLSTEDLRLKLEEILSNAEF